MRPNLQWRSQSGLCDRTPNDLMENDRHAESSEEARDRRKSSAMSLELAQYELQDIVIQFFEPSEEWMDNEVVNTTYTIAIVI